MKKFLIAISFVLMLTILSAVISHIRTLDNAQDTFCEIVSGKTNTMKVLLEIDPKA